jgi:16S rRNA processing protein RimM
VEGPDGRPFGTVESVVANPASDLLELDTGALVPLTFVVERRPGVVVIDPPDDLLD